MRKNRAYKQPPDLEVNDPKAALQIQLEMLIQRAQMAIEANRKGYHRELSGLTKRIAEISIRIHNLSHVLLPSDENRLSTVLRECLDSPMGSVSNYGDGAISIEGDFNVLKLSRRMIW